MHPAAVEQNFRLRAERLSAWGVGLLVVAALLWIYAAWQVFTPYESTYWKVDCSAPAFSDREGVYLDFEGDHEKAVRCAADRDWPAPVTALVLATPLATVGGLLLAGGWVSGRLRRHDEWLERAREEQRRARD